MITAPPTPKLADCHRCDAPDPAVNWHSASGRWTVACTGCERGVEADTLDRAADRWNEEHDYGPGLLGWILIVLVLAFGLSWAIA